jgi:hypothetical protein
MRSLILLSAFASALPLASQQPASPLTAEAIMARVAANQDSSEAARARFVYVQHAKVTSRKGHTVRCEEITDTRITPTPTGSDQQLLTLDGRLLRKGKYITYNSLAKRHDSKSESDDLSISIHSDSSGNIDDDTDRDLVENMRHNLLSTKSKDGIASNLFPLTSKHQSQLNFTLVGREPMNGRPTFHIRFTPKDPDDYDWKGDAWIDAEAFQPVVIRTALSRGIPVAVKLLLGTNVPGLGFTVTYAPQTDGVWFPTSFGTEFGIHVLYFFRREIVVSAANRDFERTHTSSHILSTGDPTQPPPPQP